MGIRFFDQYSLLHFATGVIMYFWGMPLWLWNSLHILFELIENTQFGMDVINNYIKVWPGGKPYSDALINSVGDVFFGHVGWMVGYYLDLYGIKQNWYRNPM